MKQKTQNLKEYQIVDFIIQLLQKKRLKYF